MPSASIFCRSLHARTEIRLRVELRGDRLHVAVRDGEAAVDGALYDLSDAPATLDRYKRHTIEVARRAGVGW